MTATATKPRAPKAIAVSKLIGGKMVTRLGNGPLAQLQKTRDLCRELSTVGDWEKDALAAVEALNNLIGLTQA